MRSALLSAAERTAQWTPVLLGVSIPISIAADSILLLVSVIALCIVLAFQHREYLAALARHPIAQRAVLLFVLLVLGSLYGDRFAGDTARFLSKYSDLLFLPLLLIAFRPAQTRSRAICAFAFSLALVLVLSYGVQLGWVPSAGPIRGEPGNAAVFKKDLTHNFLMAYAAFLFLQLGMASHIRRIKWAWMAAAALAIIDVVLLVRGRTGHLVLAALLMYAGYAWRGWRGFGLIFATLAAVTSLLLITPGSFQARYDRTMKEAREWNEQAIAQESAAAGKPAASRESVPARLDYYRNSLRIIAGNPLGVGTGGFPKAYEEIVRGTSAPPSVNPHNEYLLIAVQIGFVGLAALLWLFYAQWKLAPSLPTRLELHLARGLVIAFAVGCVFNSLLLDHTEGLFYAWLTALLYGGLNQRVDANRPEFA